MDGASFEQGDLYLMHVGRVRAVIRRTLQRTGQFSTANLADLVQEAFLKAFSAAARNRYDAQREYEPFLLAIARNVTVDWARRQFREQRGAQLLESEHGIVIDSKNEARHELVAVASSYLETLSPELERVHCLRFVENVPQRRAAELLGISRQNLRTLERRLIDGLKRVLEGAED